MADLKEKLKSLKPEKRAKLVNQIKREAEGSDYYELIKIECEEGKSSLIDKLMNMDKQNEIMILTGALQGIEHLSTLLFTEWKTK